MTFQTSDHLHQIMHLYDKVIGNHIILSHIVFEIKRISNLLPLSENYWIGNYSSRMYAQLDWTCVSLAHLVPQRIGNTIALCVFKVKLCDEQHCCNIHRTSKPGKLYLFIFDSWLTLNIYTSGYIFMFVHLPFFLYRSCFDSNQTSGL